MNNTGRERALGIGARVGPFEITALLGAGGMSEVWRARDSRLGRDVAVKVLPKAFDSDADRLRRFEQEAKTLASLNHPNILVVYETGHHDGAPYLVSEFLEGQTLRQLLKDGPLRPRQACEFGLQIAQGLAAAHAQGIIHRDLKPENLFVTKDARIKILDFGLAKSRTLLLDPSDPNAPPSSSSTAATCLETTAPGLLLGTPGYMAPEQVLGQPADGRSDIFAFGAVLYEMASGRRPFRRNTQIETLNSILNENPPNLSELLPGVSPMLDRIVRRCLDKQPENRFQSAKDLLFAMESALAWAGASRSQVDSSSDSSTPALSTGPPPQVVPTPGLPPAPAAAARNSAPGPSEFAFHPSEASAIRPDMSSPEPNAPTLQELPRLRSRTERISHLLKEQLSGHLETLRPLFAPERLFGKLAAGRTEVPGAERTLAELQQSYRNFTVKPYDLPATFDTTWLGLVGQAVGLEPWEYVISVQGKSVTMTAPVRWVLAYRSNYSLSQVQRVLAGAEAVRLEYLRQFVVNALVFPILLARNPKLAQLFGDLGWELNIETPAEFKGLPLVMASSILRSFRPPDDLVLAATAFSGVPAFIELIDFDAARQPKIPLQQKLEELLRE